MCMDDLTGLQSSCIFLMHDLDKSVKLPGINRINQSALKIYATFQAKYEVRINKLRTEGPQ